MDHNSCPISLDDIISARQNHVLFNSFPHHTTLYRQTLNIKSLSFQIIFTSVVFPQFVPFRDYMDRTGNHVLSMARLAKDVLAEIPDQFISYMKSRGIKPNPAPPPYTPPGHTHHHTQI